MHVSTGERCTAIRQLTVNFSRVNCGTRIDALEAWCVRTEAPWELTRCMVAREARVGGRSWVSFKCYAAGQCRPETA